VFALDRTGKPKGHQEASPKAVASWGGQARRFAQNGGNMGSIKKCLKKCLLGAALAAGVLGLSAAPAQAARIGFYIGAHAVAVPPCPGPGYAWVAGYWDDGYWTPGYWNYVGYAPRVVVRGGFGWDRGYVYHRDFDHRDRDDRHFDRDDHFRG
jgi:hypothetical protein